MEGPRVFVYGEINRFLKGEIDVFIAHKDEYARLGPQWEKLFEKVVEGLRKTSTSVNQNISIHA